MLVSVVSLLLDSALYVYRLLHMQVIVWWWWPSSAGAAFLSLHPRALIKSLRANELNLLLDDIPEEEKKKWGERGSLLLRQLFGGASVILINKRGEALAMDTVWTVSSSAANDTESAQSIGIDTSKHTYPFKCKVIPLSYMIDRNCYESQPLPYAPFLTA